MIDGNRTVSRTTPRDPTSAPPGSSTLPELVPPQSDWEFFHRVHELLNSNQLDGAESCAQEGLDIYPTSGHLLCVAARSARALGQAELAVARLQRAIALRTTFLWSYVEYFNLLSDLNRHANLYIDLIDLKNRIDLSELDINLAGALILASCRVFGGLFIIENALKEEERGQMATTIHSFLLDILITLTDQKSFEIGWADDLIVHLNNIAPYVPDINYRLRFRREIYRLNSVHKIGNKFLAVRNLSTVTRRPHLRVAILVAGQVRGLGSVRTNFPKFIADADCDVHVCVWDRAGFRLPTENRETWHFLSRVTDLGVAKFINDSKIDFGRLVSLIPDLKSALMSDVTISELRDVFGATSVFIEDENKFQEQYGPQLERLYSNRIDTASMTTATNQAKMLYLNARSNAQAQTYSEQRGRLYDFKVRIRPDILIDTQKYDLGTLLAEIGLNANTLFINAFGPVPMAGDQYAMGSTLAMNGYLDLWNMVLEQRAGYRMATSLEDPHRRLCDYFGSSDLYIRRLPQFIAGYDESRFVTGEKLREILSANGPITGSPDAEMGERDRLELLLYLNSEARRT